MCIIAACNPGAMPTETDMVNATASNPDGFGWAIARTGDVVVGHTMDRDHAIDAFLSARATHLDCAAIFHARIATHGTVNEYNCHPFAIGGTGRQAYLAHNGILPCEPGPFDRRSDSRLFAEDIVPRNGGIGSLTRKRAEWERWIGRGNKLAIVRQGRQHYRKVTVLNADAGTVDKDTGVWWSNYSYLVPPRRLVSALACATGPSLATPADAAAWWSKQDVCDLCETAIATMHISGVRVCAPCSKVMDWDYCTICGESVTMADLVDDDAGDLTCIDCLSPRVAP